MANPGFGYSRSTEDGGKFDARYPACPDAKREYWGLNFSLDKRLSDRWLGGFSYTWSRLTGNYSGLASSDEYIATGEARNSPNVERNFDTWYLAYDKELNLIDGVLATTGRTSQALRRLYVPLSPDRRRRGHRDERAADDRILEP
jgi:hypothetical protein